MTEQIFFTQDELAERWQITPRTLEMWRWKGTGPKFHKIGRRVLYKLPDIIAFEGSRATSQSRRTHHA